MLKPIKWLFSIILFMVVAVLLAIVIVPKVVDPNDYRDELSQLVLEKTGRQLKLEGDLSVSLFPWVGIKTQQLSLSQPEQMSANEPPMIRVDAAQLRVKFMPLFSKRVEIDTIVLNKPSVSLITLQNGVDSFTGLSSQDSEQKHSVDVEANTAEQAGKVAFALVVQGLSLQEGQFLWDDRQQQSKTLVRNVNIETGDLLSGQFALVEVQGQLFSYSSTVESAEALPLDFILQGEAKIDIETAQVDLRALDLKAKQGNYRADTIIDALSFTQEQGLKIQGIGLDAVMDFSSDDAAGAALSQSMKLAGRIDALDYQLEQETASVRGVNLKSAYQQRDFVLQVPQANLDLQKEQLLMKLVTLQSDDLHLTLDSLQVSQLMSEPTVVTGLTLAPFNLKKLLADVQVDYQAKDEAALNRVALSSNVQASMDSLELTKLNLELDNSHLNGDVQLKSFNQPVTDFHLVLDQLNIDDYLPESEVMTNSVSSEAEEVTGAQALIVPMAIFKEITANGQFKAQQLTASGVTLTDIDVAIKSTPGHVTITPKADLYKGSLGGTLEYTEQADGVQLRLKNKVSLVDLGSLLSAADVSEQLTGIGSLELDLLISDKSGVQSNQGTVKLFAKDGALQGVNIQKILRDGQQTYNQLRGKEVKQGETELGDETKFAELLGTFNIDNFRISNNDFSLKAPLFRITGKGDINIAKQSLDYLVSVAVVNSLKGQGGEALNDLKGLVLPIRFKGSLLSPDYSLDLKALYKAVAEKEINAKKDEYLQRKLGVENASKLSTSDLLKQALIKKVNDKYSKETGEQTQEETAVTEVNENATVSDAPKEIESAKAKEESRVDDSIPDVQSSPEQSAEQQEEPQAPVDSKEALKEELKNRILEGLFK